MTADLLPSSESGRGPAEKSIESNESLITAEGFLLASACHLIDDFVSYLKPEMMQEMTQIESGYREAFWQQ